MELPPVQRVKVCDRRRFQEQHPIMVIVNKGQPGAEQLNLDHAKSPSPGGGAKQTSAASPFCCDAAAAVTLWIDRVTLDSLSCDVSPYRLSEEAEKLPVCNDTVSTRVPVGPVWLPDKRTALLRGVASTLTELQRVEERSLVAGVE